MQSPEPTTVCERHRARALAPGPNPVKDTYDTSAHPLVYIASQPPRDRHHFYSTTNSTTHVGDVNLLLRGTINGVTHTVTSRKGGEGVPPSQRTKQQTGYTKNVLAYVEYDRNVDEGPHFRTEVATSVTTQEFQRPASRKAKNEFGGVANVVDSGFTRLPKFDVTDDGSHHKERDSQMRSSFLSGALNLKPPHWDKHLIVPTESGFVHNAGHLRSIGTGEDERFPKPEPPKPPKHYNPTTMVDDSYTRSTRARDELKTDDAGKPIHPRLLQKPVMEHLRHADLAEWVHRKDVANNKSLSRVVHAPLDSLEAMHSLRAETEVRTGLKEPSGSVRNNPKFFSDNDPMANERFTTETKHRFQMPVDRFRLGNFTCDMITKSGFTNGNGFQYTKDASSQAEIYQNMHPTVAKYNWIRERGLNTSKPTQRNYTLVV
ncbi:hypothetical protein HK101_011694 [Irineochytrium annulatum]|nr:hypothetical protein HK101_011694 [Irineochytrium annulatum]